MQHNGKIMRIIGIVLAVFGIGALLDVPLGFIAKDEQAGFIVGGILFLGVGALLFYLGYKKKKSPTTEK